MNSEQHSVRGEHLEYDLDWQAGTMTLRKASLNMLKHHSSEPVPITHWIVALEAIYRANQQEAGEEHFYSLDVRYNRSSLTATLHRSENYNSVVNVAREQLAHSLQSVLTPREIDVAILLFEGSTIKNAANQLGIAEGTAKRIIFNIYQKLNISSHVDLIREIYARLAELPHIASMPQESKGNQIK